MRLNKGSGSFMTYSHTFSSDGQVDVTGETGSAKSSVALSHLGVSTQHIGTYRTSPQPHTPLTNTWQAIATAGFQFTRVVSCTMTHEISVVAVASLDTDSEPELIPHVTCDLARLRRQPVLLLWEKLKGAPTSGHYLSITWTTPTKGLGR